MVRQRRRTGRASRALSIILAVVLFTGLFMQIGWLSDITKQAKKNDAMVREIAEMNAAADNLRVALSRYHNLDAIREKAEELGMKMPDSTQIRVISLPAGMTGDTSAQTAMLNGGDEMAE